MKKRFIVGYYFFAVLFSIGLFGMSSINKVQAEDTRGNILESTEETTYYMQEIFPDEVFRNLVTTHLQTLSVPVDSDGTVTQSELNQLTRISENYVSKIKTLEGAQYLKNLEYINLIHTNIESLDPLEKLEKLSWIKITNSDISDVSALNEISKNKAQSMTIELNSNKVTDFSFVPEVVENLNRTKKWSKKLRITDQYVKATHIERFDELPLTIQMPSVLLHDGSKLEYESLSSGHFENGNYILEQFNPESRHFSGRVNKKYDDNTEYGVFISVDARNNYLFPKGIETEFTINVNEEFDYESPFKNAETTENWGFLWAHTFKVNKEELNINKPGKYILDYSLIKFNHTQDPLEGIPFKVTVNVLPVTYHVEFKVGYWWEESYRKIATNPDMTITPPEINPKKEGYIFEGWAYDDQENSNLVDFSELIRQDTIFYAKWKKDKPQGEYIKDGRYVTVTKKEKGTYSNFEWNSRESADVIFGKTYQARGKYKHRNGNTYYSLYNGNGKWMGYIDSNDVKDGNGQQGAYMSDGNYVTVTNKGYDSWSNFKWSKKQTNNKLLNKTFLAKGKYVHVNGSTYYSIFDNKGVWQGYINAKGTKVGKGKQGAYISDGRRVSVKKRNYNSWSSFSWKKKYSGTYFTDTTYEARGKYHHINGTTYYSLYNVNGLWLGYMSEKALR